MAKINLGRERGVQPTGSAQHGSTSPRGFESVMHGASRLNAAADNVARGMRHVSDSLFHIYNDQAETRNRQEFLEGQTQQFDITQKENELLEARIEKGEFEGEGGLERFKIAVGECNDKIDNAFSDWATKNITREDTRNNLIEKTKLDSKKNFAYLSGRFIAHDKKRRWDMCENQMNDAVKSGNYQNGITAIDAYCTNKSPELKKEMLKKYNYGFCSQRMADAKVAIQGASTPEEIENIIANLKSEGFYFGIYENDQKAFDVFACHRLDILEDKEAREEEADIKSFLSEEKAFVGDLIQQEKNAKALEDTQRKDLKKSLDLKKKTMSSAMRVCIETGDAVYENLDVNGCRQQLIDYFKQTSLSADELTAALEDFDNFVAEEKVRIRKQVESSMKQQAKDVLLQASEKGSFDIEALSGKNISEAKKLRIAQAEFSKTREAYNLLKTKIDSKQFTPEEERNWAIYKASYFKTLTGILTYDEASDSRGEKLARLCVEIDKFDDDSRKELLNALNGKVNGNIKSALGKAPSNWNSEDLKLFDKEIKDLCEWDDDTLWFGDDSDPVAFAKLRNRMLQYASVRQLNLQETLKEMREDPFFKRVYLKKSMREAQKFLKL